MDCSNARCDTPTSNPVPDTPGLDTGHLTRTIGHFSFHLVGYYCKRYHAINRNDEEKEMLKIDPTLRSVVVGERKSSNRFQFLAPFWPVLTVISKPMDKTGGESSSDEAAQSKALSIQPYKEQLGSLMKDLRSRENELLEKAGGLEHAYFTQVNKRAQHFDAAKKIVANSLNQVIQHIGQLGNKMLTMVDQQKEQIESLESRMNILNQAIDIHNDKVALQQFEALGVSVEPVRKSKKTIIKDKTKTQRYTRKAIDFNSLDDVGQGAKSKVGQVRGKRAESLQPKFNRQGSVSSTTRSINGSMETGNTSIRRGSVPKSGSLSSVNSNTSQPVSSTSSEINESPRQSRSSSIKSVQSGTSSGTVSVVQTKRIQEKTSHPPSNLRAISSKRKFKLSIINRFYFDVWIE
ncbi:Abl interactor 1 [Trichoplax sp. H2]|nr:Abl interactor 1 [Trichoplax sp. H2]|eukprot:RDD41560.1 Abl interactor 1 [Trichoplax sp. H2]